MFIYALKTKREYICLWTDYVTQLCCTALKSIETDSGNLGELHTLS